MLMKVHKFGLAVLGGILLLHPYVLAQTSTGSISGVVEDESGAVIPSVKVTVTNVDTGISRALVADASGRYHAPTLIPGHYEVQAQIEGFETGIRKGIQVTVGSNLAINLVLKVGQVTQITVVTAEAPMVETATSTLSALVDDRTIRELPLNARSFDQLISLESSSPTFRQRRPTGGSHGMSAVYSVNGARTRSNIFMMDGTEVVSAGSISLLPGGVLGKNMGVEAVQEFAVLSGNYSSAYGKKAGGIINIATRSGTNVIHGSAFEFLRNSALDARNFFDPTPEPPPFKRNQFGGAIGGPIRKDHSFFFGTYEGLRDGLGLTNIAVVPDANAHQGLLPNPRNPGQFNDVGVASEVKPYLAALYPLPNGRSFGDGTGEFLSNPQQISSQDFFLIRFDQRISDKDSLFGRYNFTRASQNSPEAIPFFDGIEKSRDQIMTLEAKRASARTVNVLRFGFTRGQRFNTTFATVPVDPGLRFQPGVDLVGQIGFSSSPTAAAPLSRGGPSSAVNRAAVVNQFEVAHQVFHYRGPHSLQFGGQVQRIQNNFNSAPSEIRGVFEFDDLVSFLQGKARLYRGLASGANDATKGLRQIYFSSFLQDDYKVLRNLTLNLGLRYELLTVPVDATNRLSNYRRRFVDGFLILDSEPTLGNPFFQGNHKGFAPRIGFAWDPNNDGKLAVRGGFGMFYDQVDGEYLFFLNNNPPFVSALLVENPPFPLGFSGGTGTSPLPAPDVLDFGFQTPTRLQYSIGVQRQITSSSVFNISYVGARSYHLSRQLDFNSARPRILPGGIYFYPAGSPRLNPALGQTRSTTTDGTGFYNSVQLDFVQRVSRGLRYKVSYTYARNIDDASITTGSQAAGSPPSPQNPFDRKPERALSNFDLRHNLVTNFTYDVPGSNLSGLSGRLLGGWQLGSILTFSTGTPFTAQVGFNRSRDAARYTPDRPSLKAGANNNPVLGGPDLYFDPTVFELQPAGFYGNLGRNTLIGPGFANVDFTLVKMTTVNERLKVDFRAEFFNLLNRANFGLPRLQIFDRRTEAILGTAGRIQETVTTSRQIQFGLKLTF